MYYIRKSDGLAYCFSPVPLIADSKEHLQTIVDGTEVRLGVIHTLTFNGTLLPNLPALSGVDPDATCLELLDRKSDQLCTALDEDRGNLLIVDATGYPVISVNPIVRSISFDESQMINQRPYSIVFEYEDDFDGVGKIRDFQENWDFSAAEDDTIGVSHTVSAIGVSDLPAGTGALQNAKTFVLARANILDKTQSRFLKGPFVQTIVDVDSLLEFNHVRSERVDESAGSYEITESWILASGAFKDDRTTDTSSAPDEFGDLVESLNINGTVQGYGDTTFQKFDNAVTGFETFVVPQINFNSSSGVVSKNRSDNRFAGTVNYSITFDSVDANNILEERTITRSLQRNEDGSVTQSVNTSASVKQSSPSGIEAAIEFCFANNFPISSFVEPFFDASLSGNLESVSYERDDINKSFNLSRVFRDQETQLYREEFEVSREQNVENALTTVSVNGSVFGLGVESGTKSTVRFNSASGAFFNIVEPLISSRALSVVPTGTCLGSSPISQTFGFNELNGTITYDFTFNNRFITDNPNIFDEKVDISVTLQSDVVAEIPIPGKPTGPILQDQETKTGLQKTLKISYTMRPSGQDCGVVSAGDQRTLELEAIAESDILINNTIEENERGEKPVASKTFKNSDQYTFNRQSFVFTRSTSWKYTATPP